MNYLAHALLSFDDPAIMVGNLSGDAVKGRQYLDYPTGIREGLLLHRYIDSYTDTHELMQSILSFFKGDFGRYSGIVVDVLCDHLLAHSFSRYSSLTFHQFVSKVYTNLEVYHDQLPPEWKERAMVMRQYKWLESYFELQGVSKALKGMTKRYVLPVDLSSSIHNYLMHRAQIEKLFSQFFNELTLALPTLYKDVTLKIGELG